MTVNDSRLWKGTLTFGETATALVAAGQTTNFVIEQQDGDSEDTANVLSGETVGGETTAGPWHITFTMIQDHSVAGGLSLQEWSYRNRDTQQPFTFSPNDGVDAPSISGIVNVKFLGLGGDVKVRITRDADWGLVGAPTFTEWDVPPIEAVSAKSKEKVEA
jgi:hypothetical protein